MDSGFFAECIIFISCPEHQKFPLVLELTLVYVQPHLWDIKFRQFLLHQVPVTAGWLRMKILPDAFTHDQW